MRSWKIGAIACLMAALTTTLPAQDDPSKRNDPNQPAQVDRQTETKTVTSAQRVFNQAPKRVQKASDLIGKDVDTTAGDDLGDIDDLIVDVNSGRVIYLLVSCEMTKQCIVPTLALDLPPSAEKFVFAGTKDTLKAFVFDKNQFPEITDRTWAMRIHTHHKQTPYWERVETTTITTTPSVRTVSDNWYQFTNHWHKASDIMGMEVKNPQNEKLGKIEDLAIDPDTGRVIYGVLSFGGFLGVGDKLFAIPWGSLKEMSSDHKSFVLKIDKNRLKNAQGFDKKNYPNMADPRWATEIHTFYGEPPYWQETTTTTTTKENKDNEKP